MQIDRHIEQETRTTKVDCGAMQRVIIGVVLPRVQACQRDSLASDEAMRTREPANEVRRALIEAGTRRRVSAGSRPRTDETMSRGPAAAAGARAPETARRSAR